MLSEAIKRRIADACVTVGSGDVKGRGVLVGAQLVLTAAHNIVYYLDETAPRPLASAPVGLATGDHVVIPIETSHGLLHVAPLAIEPVQDIAVLGALDNQVFWDEVEAYEAWCEAVAPIPLCYEDLPLWQPVPVAVYTHRDTWLEGTAELGRPDARWTIVTMPDGIEGGTSGSPIVTVQGAIMGIVSQFGGSEPDALTKGRQGPAPRPHLTLPAWVLRQIQYEEEGVPET